MFTIWNEVAFARVLLSEKSVRHPRRESSERFDGESTNGWTNRPAPSGRCR
jgi:hypothetical protein